MKKSIRVEELVSLIEGYQASYYGGEAEISDEAFDQLWDLLKEKDQIIHFYKDSSDILPEERQKQVAFSKVRHLIPMGSQRRLQIQKSFEPGQIKCL